MKLRRTIGVIASVFVAAILLSACGSGSGGGGNSPTSTPGQSSIVTSQAAIVPGATCPTGGISIDIGIDDNGNGALDPAEVDATQNVCNGLDSLVSIVSEPSGTNCTNGGFKVTSGSDVNGSGSLDAGEVAHTQYACNGANGTDGTNGNSAPNADAGPDQKAAAAGTQVTLNGSASSDPDGDMITYAWSLIGRPVGSMSALSSSVVSGPTFTPDMAGAYVLGLVVNDGIVNSLPDTVTIRAGMPIPDTGQTRWYSVQIGEDGDYDINTMSYTDNGDGTIFDNVTGLTWQKCSVGQNNDATCTGSAITNNWSAAATACSNLNLAGTGWRMPTRLELLTIVNYGLISGPAMNSAYFPGTVLGTYWSSTTYAGDPLNAWYVNAGTARADYSLKTGLGRLRCVR